MVSVSDLEKSSEKHGLISGFSNDVARGAGFVMDHCTRADNTVQGGEMAYGNGNMEVWIRKP